MRLLRTLLRGLRVLGNRAGADQDISDEVQHYLDQATQVYLARGLSPEAASRAARMEIGGETQVREQVRSSGWENAVSDVVADVRYGARRLVAAPTLTAVLVFTLSLGLGAATAILGVVGPILLAPLPYPDDRRLVSVQEWPSESGRIDGTFAMYREFQERARAFETLAVFKPWRPVLTGGATAVRVEGQQVSADFFRVLGVAPLLGRDFDSADDLPNGGKVVLISHQLWRERFDQEAAIIGRPVSLDDDAFTVIGVMPQNFEHALAPAAVVWSPLQYDPALPPTGREWGHHLRTVGRMRAGVGIEAAISEIDAVGRDLVRARRPETYDPQTAFSLAFLRDELTSAVRPVLLMLLAAATLLLVTACVNVTNLLLGRAAQRRPEFALRAALGAGRARVVRQVLTESLLLAAVASVVGVVVAGAGVQLLLAASPQDLPRSHLVGTPRVLLGYGLSLAVVVGLAFGLVPAFHASRPEVLRSLGAGGRLTSGHRHIRASLVVAEIALALVLSVTSGLLLRSLLQLIRVSPGFESQGLLALQVQAAGHRFDADGAATAFYARLGDAVRDVAGVTEVGLTSQLPISGDRDEYGAQFEPDGIRPTSTFGAFRYAVSPGYTEAMRIPLLRGRTLQAADQLAGAPVAVIGASLAQARFGDRDPIGQRVRIGPAGPYTIVGVVGDAKQMSRAAGDSAAVYTTAEQWPFAERAMWLVVRARGDAAALAPAIRQAVQGVDADQPIVRVAMMTDLVAASEADRRFALVVIGVFGITTLLLAAAGIYGVINAGVVERRREFGVRVALGASPRAILALVASEASRLGALGIAIGVAGALGASGLVASQLFGVSRLDPVTYVAVVVLVGAVATMASAGPAWRAARVDPAATLRTE